MVLSFGYSYASPVAKRPKHSTKTSSRKKRTTKQPKVRPVFLGFLAAALLSVGLGLGILTDVLLTPDPAPVYRAAPYEAAPRPERDFGVRPRTEPPVRQPARGIAPAYERFAADAPPQDGRPRIAIVIDDLGPDVARTSSIIALPGPLTLAFLTYDVRLDDWSAEARAAGHEVFAHVPMEPLDQSANPGPGALLVEASSASLKFRLSEYLDHWSGYAGINNHMGSRFTADDRAMQLVMAELKARQLMWLDSLTSAGTRGIDQARMTGVPFAVRDVFLDNDPTVEAVSAQLRQLEASALANGSAIGIGHPKDGTIDALADWLATLDQRGFSLVPVTALRQMPDGQG